MVLSDALVEEIYQTLAKLPFATVAPLIGKMQIEAAQQKDDKPAHLNGHQERQHANFNKSKPA